MPQIDRIYIACFKHDVRFTKILVASIRFWYPRIAITLIKDETYGPFSTSELERGWQVSVLKTETKKFGWGFGKLEPLFLPEKQRILVLDSDIVMVGPVLDLLAQYNEDFIVTQEDPPDRNFVERLYFDIAKLQEADELFVYPGYTFNTGQIVATTGILSRADFDRFVDWGDPPTLKSDDIFHCGEQGLLNYVLMKKFAARVLTMRRVPFMQVADNLACQQIKIAELNEKSPYQFVIHWCGLDRTPYSPALAPMARQDILLYFEKRYYRGISFGPIRRFIALSGSCLQDHLRKTAKRLLLSVGWRRRH